MNGYHALCFTLKQHDLKSFIVLKNIYFIIIIVIFFFKLTLNFSSKSRKRNQMKDRERKDFLFLFYSAFSICSTKSPFGRRLCLAPQTQTLLLSPHSHPQAEVQTLTHRSILVTSADSLKLKKINRMCHSLEINNYAAGAEPWFK